MSKELREQFEQAGQGHVFRFWDELSDAEQTQLISDAKQIDLAEIDRLNNTLVQGEGAHGVDTEDLEPAPFAPLPEHGGDATQWEKAYASGEEAFAAGRVACFTVAGGQGTRLGYDGPKGTFPVTPLKNKTLFQVFAEKIKSGGLRYGKPIHWFIMTSRINHEATVEFFEQNRFFGLDKAYVHFFSQGLMPAVTPEGKIILSDKSSIAMTPDGHGGSLRALVRSGAVDIMEKEGIDMLSYFQVDNPLTNFLDAAFVGFHLQGNSELSSKMIPKAYAEEKVGHFCVQNGKHIVIEYSDLPEDLMQARTSDGQLKYGAGSVAIHIFDRDFIRKIGSGESEAFRLPFHRADKKIPFVDDNGTIQKPDNANGIKFEMFVFDALPFAENPVIIEGRRGDEFSPVKNADGRDSPQTCKDDQMRQWARWLLAAGAAIQVDETKKPTITLEISPLFAYEESMFLTNYKALAQKPTLADGLYIE